MRQIPIIIALALAASATAAAAEPVGAPVAKVAGHRVVNPIEKVTVIVPASARYIGSERFDLFGVADAEVHVFAEADAEKRMKRLYWVQFESYWPSKPDLTHNYSDDRRTQHWGTTIWLRSRPAAVNTPRTGSDRERVQALLTRAGYTIPPEVMNVRMVQLLDDPKGTGEGRRELMLIYSEDLALTGKTLADLTTDDKPNESWKPLEQALIERATTRFKVKRG